LKRYGGSRSSRRSPAAWTTSACSITTTSQAELGLTDGESLTGFGGGLEPDLSDLEDIGGNGGSALDSPRSWPTSTCRLSTGMAMVPATATAVRRI
jgi:hypothetical protein